VGQGAAARVRSRAAGAPGEGPGTADGLAAGVRVNLADGMGRVGDGVTWA